MAEEDKETAFFAVGAGAYNVFDKGQNAADFRLEYRPKLALWGLRTWVGVEATTEEALYGLAGLLLDINLGKRWLATASGGAGVYADGDGKNLGHSVEFRLQIEMAYRIQERSRLGVAVSHISNAGLGHENPGTEVVSLYYAIPLGAVSATTD